MAILSNGKFYGFLCSARETGRTLANGVREFVEYFMSGFAGYGWKIWEYVKGKWMLEIDSIRVREQFIVFEMLVSKMRAIIGSLGISQACGKIAAVTLSEDGTEYLITLEDETMSFVAHDFMRCQTYTGTKQTFYHVEISSVVEDVIHVPVSEFDVDAEGIVINPPEVGNDIVQFGNSVNKDRQSAIYIHADESGQPAIDIMFDIDGKDWSGKIKTRLGGDIPGGNGVRGFYCENGMIKGTDTGGHTVYCIHPDGTAEFGDGSAKFSADRSGYLAGGAISWRWDSAKSKYVCTMGDVILTWDNLDDETKENLKGESGIGIKETDVEYAISTSNTTSPTAGWQTTSPIWVDGKYIWSRTKVAYTDNSIKYTSAVCITGGKGASGDEGKGVSSIVEQYYLSSSSSSLTGGAWSTERPAWKNGWYIWTRSVITYTDSTSTVTDAICVTGEKGDTGLPGENAVMFAIEFYMNGFQVQNIPCDIRSNPVGGSTLVAKLFRIKGSTKELYSAGNWIVNHRLNGTDVSDLEYSSTRSSVDIVIADVDDFDSISVGVAGGYSPDDPVISASGTIAKVMANVPDWLIGWDTNKVQIGSEYMISPKLFTGKNTGTAEEPILTGVVQGKDCITIDGVERSGIFALVDNEVVFELDPINGEYKFNGSLSTSSSGQRVEINPQTKSINIIDSSGKLVSIFDGNKYAGKEQLFDEVDNGKFTMGEHSSYIGTADKGLILEISDRITLKTAAEITVPFSISCTSVYIEGGIYDDDLSDDDIHPYLESTVRLFIKEVTTNYEYNISRVAASVESANDQQYGTQRITVHPGTYAIMIEAYSYNNSSVRSAVSWNIGESSWESMFYMSRIFANGFAFGTKPRNSAILINDDDGGIEFEVISGDYGLSLSSEGVDIKIGDVWKRISVSGDGSVKAFNV